MSRCVFNCSAVTVDPPQSAEIDRLDEDFAAAAAAAAMSTVLLDEEVLALSAVFACLGAMVCGRCALRGKEMGAGATEKLGNERDG